MGNHLQKTHESMHNGFNCIPRLQGKIHFFPSLIGRLIICRRPSYLVISPSLKALQQRDKWISKTKSATLWENAHERNAKRILRLIVALEGLWVKLGQYLSTRADVLPEAYISLLKQLQDSLPPRPLQEVVSILFQKLIMSIYCRHVTWML